ncbi:Folliculin [Wickerhamomyces ciferrii]|uniref:Folliculin n=1 Tax=Wickerhamomyces ciferrii (strain ATCC 14091 / BCRC 22168 / CBS 111 / JCM 3599 / NBRC 0793 / NRRL Y-1031 F-60-10) TaxID=1206466 RepID=K0KK18_WICCF|nr:Folliculin [Wickerhamomyces ciferrii]CCH41799.1 Folliculin [Wickerhamomyces ciferrii]
MAFTITLAHFCDKHGPRSIMCTQTTELSQMDQSTLPDFSKESYCKSCLLIYPKSTKGENVTTLRTEDTKTNHAFVSTQYSAIKFRVLNSIVRKCLSEEATIYDSKPMFFGDENRGYSMTQSFKIKDLEARGSERRYSFIVNCDQEHQVLENWDLIKDSILVMIEYLQKSSLKIELENSKNHEIYLRGKVQHSKSLIEMLKDDELFLKLHLWNSKLLRKLINK